MANSLTFSLQKDGQIENVENALTAVEEHLEVTVSRSRGRAAADEITLAEALEELAIAYTGIDVTEHEHLGEHD